MVKVNITDEDMAPRNNNYFDEGVHEVVIAKAERGTTDNDKDYVELTVQGQNEEEGTARLWFTTEAAGNYALSILAGIAVHNKESETDKQKVRDAFKKIDDTDLVDDAFLKKFVEMEAFYMVQMSDRTYVNNQGETKNSYDRNIYGYSPTMKTRVVEPTKNAVNSDPVDLSDIPF